MKRFTQKSTRLLSLFAVALLAALVYVIAEGAGDAVPTAHALPEYAARTNESCSTCHVNPGGGGPRTLRGLLWAAQGKPDQVPELPAVLLAPGINDGADLWDIACASCHGGQGEGGFGVAIANSGLKANKIRSTIQRGRLRSGMPAFKGQFTDEQLETLVSYAEGLATGLMEPAPAALPLPAAEFTCQSQTTPVSCGGN